MQAFHNDPNLKAQLLEMARQHREADDYIAGTYCNEDDERFRGCSVGCTVRDINSLKGKEGNYDDHAFLAEQLGVPEFIARLQDRIFEGLPADQRSGWTERLLAAIPVGADLTPVLPRFLLSVQRRNLARLDQKAFPQIYDAILGVVDVLQGWADTGRVDESAAWAAAWAESAWSAWSAAESGSESVRLARSAEYSKMADDLVQLIQEAK